MTSVAGPQVASALMRLPTARTGTGGSGYHPRLCAAVLLSVDCMAAAAIVCAASYFYIPDDPTSLAPMSLIGLAIRPDMVLLSVAIIVYFVMKGRYRDPIPFWSETRLVVSTCLVAIGAEAMLAFFASGRTSPAPVYVVLLTLPILTISANWLAKRILSFVSPWTVPVVLVGDNPIVYEQALQSDRSLGYRFVGRVSPDEILTGFPGPHLLPLLKQFNGCRLFIAVDDDRQRRLVQCALRERVPFALMPSHAFPFEPTFLFSHNTMLLSFRDGLSRPLARVAKVAFDLTVATILLIITSPLFILLMMINGLKQEPTYFSHQRIGARGTRFRCLKFRTMVTDANQVLEKALAQDPALAAEWAATRKLANDPRITRMGRFLRRTSLDELPQLINVIRLEMSLVGPRPIVESEIPYYGEDIAQYYAIRPGMTGLWQVSGRSSISYERRVQLDVWYVNNWTIWHDIVVLLKTIPAVLARRGAV